MHLCIYIQPHCCKHANVYIHTTLYLHITNMSYILGDSCAMHMVELTLEKIPRVIIDTVGSVCALPGHVRCTRSA